MEIATSNYRGRKEVLYSFFPSRLFAESYALLHKKAITVHSFAETDVVIMFLDIEKLFLPCGMDHTLHTMLIRNLFNHYAQITLFQTDRIKHTSKRSIRTKVLAYLADQRSMAGSPYFDIPLNRQQLADYLCVDRSALSAELCKMRDEGILEFNRSSFHFLAQENEQ